MSLAESLLNSIDETTTEGHIVIGNDRYITVPDELKRLAVQYDHNIETVTFDCPRYWDGLDMSAMAVYINYMLPKYTKIFNSFIKYCYWYSAWSIVISNTCICVI